MDRLTLMHLVLLSLELWMRLGAECCAISVNEIAQLPHHAPDSPSYPRQVAEEQSRMIYSKVIGTGGYLPEKILTNHDLERMVDTSDEWIRTRTGIMERHIAAEDEMASDSGAQCQPEAQ